MMVVLEITSQVTLLFPHPVPIYGYFLCIPKTDVKVDKLWRYKEVDVVLPGSEAWFQYFVFSKFHLNSQFL